MIEEVRVLVTLSEYTTGGHGSVFVTLTCTTRVEVLSGHHYDQSNGTVSHGCTHFLMEKWYY